jgi:mono/diheme cytochrome c family protein
MATAISLWNYSSQPGSNADRVDFMNGSLIGSVCFLTGMFVVCLTARGADEAISAGPPANRASASGLKWLVGNYCRDCHHRESATAGLDLEKLLEADVSADPAVWEKVVRRISTRQMPPVDAPRPNEQEIAQVQTWLEQALNEVAAKHPNPGRTESFRRLTRTEYGHAIRDLLALNIDVTTMLPADESSHGFDNITVTGLSPTLVNRYLTAAEKISRIAMGRTGRGPAGETIRLRPDITQDVHVAGLPFGTRGGALIPWYVPVDGEYEVQVRLMRDRNEGIEGLKEPHELEVRLDRQRQALFRVAPPKADESEQSVDAGLRVRLQVTAGAHDLTVTFLKKPSSLLETTRQPLNVHFNYYRHPRLGPAIYEVSIVGPFTAAGARDTDSRRRILICTPANASEQDSCARQILSSLMRRAFRRPVNDEDVQRLMAFYAEGHAEGGFEAGIERALSAILVNPRFLFRIESDPEGIKPGQSYQVSDLELASRLSFFLWSSLPDEELLSVAERGQLRQPEVLDAQVQRMLADDRSRSLVTHFAGQWLHLQNLDAVTPDMRLFPDFDHNLRQAFREETELFVESVLRENRSVLDLLRADYTFLNERLAKHYEIPHVYGSRFRRVDLEPGSHRGGLLRQGSILTVTSYATRTSPVNRGKWVLENLLGSPPPAPPPNVPALEDNTVLASLSGRERLAAHRANPACASCHNVIDPVGFSLENFDAVGRWRILDEGSPVDATGGMPDGLTFVGIDGLEEGLLRRPELFVRTLVEKLLTWSLGRGVEYTDAAAIRRVVAEAGRDDYRFSSLIRGIVHSPQFQMRRVE